MTTADVLARGDWWVGDIPSWELRRIVEAEHYSGVYRGQGGYWHGLFRRGEWPFGHVHGACVWMAQVPLMTRFGKPPLVLTRLAIEPHVPRNAASFLLRRSMRLIDRQRWPVLVTYADEGQGHTGGIYTAAGWTFDGIGGEITYRNPATGEWRSSLGAGSRFLPRPDGWEAHRTRKRRFLHIVPATTSDEPDGIPDSQLQWEAPNG